MTRCPLRVVPLLAEHDRSTFASGCDPLDNDFRQRVTQDLRRRVAFPNQGRSQALVVRVDPECP